MIAEGPHFGTSSYRSAMPARAGVRRYSIRYCECDATMAPCNTDKQQRPDLEAEVQAWTINI